MKPTAVGGADIERPSQVEPTTVGGADTEQSGQVEPCGEGGGGQGLGVSGTPGSAIYQHGLDREERAARDVISDYVQPALVGNAGVGGAADVLSGGVSLRSRAKRSTAYSAVGIKKYKRERRRASGAESRSANLGDDGGGSCHSAVSALSDPSFSGATPMSQRSAGSLARHQANEAVKAEITLEITLLRATLEATQSAGESARKVAALGMGVPDGVI